MKLTLCEDRSPKLESRSANAEGLPAPDDPLWHQHAAVMQAFDPARRKPDPTRCRARGRRFRQPARWHRFRTSDFRLRISFGFRLSVFGFLLAVLLSACSPSAGPGKAQKWFCPMHPAYVSDRTGDCPICNMKLVLAKDAASTNASSADSTTPASDPDAEFRCPDHPAYTYHEPGVCDECGKPYQPMNAAAEATQARHVPGRVSVFIAPEKQQLIGLSTTLVTNRPLARIIRAAATLEHDETQLARIAPRFGGWVIDLKVNQTGQEVERGQPLLTVYSPEVYAAESEYVLAWQRAQQSDDAGKAAAKNLLESSRRRLTLWGIGEEEIRALEKSGEPQNEVLLRAPLTGHVIAKRVQAGQSFMPGDSLFEIGAMSPLWMRASVYESDLPFVKVGESAVVLMPTLGGLSVTSKVDLIYPHIEPETRRAQVRLVIENPGHRLRPDMWAEVVIQASIGDVLSVPASAVIDTGTRYVAFVVGADSHFEPRQLRIGLKTDDWWQVEAGLRPGERVVTRALFLVDAESQLKSALTSMASGEAHQR